MKTRSKEFIVAQKKSLVRRFIFLLPSDESNSGRTYRNSLLAQMEDLKDRIIQKLNRLSLKGNIVPKIKLLGAAPPTLKGENQLDTIVKRLPSNHELRVIVNMHQPVQLEENSLLIDYEITHLLEVNTPKKATQERASGFEEIIRVKAHRHEQILSLIEDAMLDIAMFHTYVEKGDEILQYKVKASFRSWKESWLQENFPDHYHQVQLPFIASYFREVPNNFNFSGYVHAWKDLAKNFLSRHNIQDIHSTLNEQLRNYKQLHQLPLKRLQLLYDKLPAGEYLLIRSGKKPSKTIKAREIYPLLKLDSVAYLKRSSEGKGKKVKKGRVQQRASKKFLWRQGRTNIIPLSFYAKVTENADYLSVFKLVKS